MIQNYRGPSRFPQLAKEPLIKSNIKANPENRVLAKILDVLLCEGFLFFLSLFLNSAPFFVAPLFWALIERVGRGQSPGKWLLGLHTIEVERGYKPNLYSSLVRNFPFILFSIALRIDGKLGLALSFFSIALMGIETYFIFGLRSGIRYCDILASTRVADFKDEHTKFVEQFLKEEESASN